MHVAPPCAGHSDTSRRTLQEQTVDVLGVDFQTDSLPIRRITASADREKLTIRDHPTTDVMQNYQVRIYNYNAVSLLNGFHYSSLSTHRAVVMIKP